MPIGPSVEDQFLNYLQTQQRLIWKIVRSYCSEPEDQKDLEQDIIVQLWRAFPRYDASYAPSTWTYRIALNVAFLIGGCKSPSSLSKS